MRKFFSLALSIVFCLVASAQKKQPALTSAKPQQSEPDRHVSLEQFKKKPSEMKAYLKGNQKPNAELAALSVVANAIINLDEFVTKQ